MSNKDKKTDVPRSLDGLVRKTIEDLIKFAPTNLCCEDFHHSKKDRHEWDEACPCVLRYEKAVDAARTLLVANVRSEFPNG